MVKKARNRGRTSKITIRLERDVIDVLRFEAEEEGITITEVIRTALEERLLHGAKLDETRHMVQQVRTEVRKLRKELALSTEAVLCFGGKTPKEEARRWVSETFGREG